MRPRSELGAEVNVAHVADDSGVRLEAGGECLIQHSFGVTLRAVVFGHEAIRPLALTDVVTRDRPGLDRFPEESAHEQRVVGERPADPELARGIELSGVARPRALNLRHPLTDRLD